MRRVQGGDEVAFTALVERHQQRVVNIAARYLGRSPDCDDLAQEIFLRVWRARARWQPTARFTTWLYQVAANACLNWIRDQRRHRMASLDAPASPGSDAPREPADPAARAPDTAAGEAERATLVRAAIAGLPDQQRMAVLLFRQEGCSYVEVAQAMGTSLPAVKSLLNRAKENLRKALGPLLGDAGEAGTSGSGPGSTHGDAAESMPQP